MLKQYKTESPQYTATQHAANTQAVLKQLFRVHENYHYKLSSIAHRTKYYSPRSKRTELVKTTINSTYGIYTTQITPDFISQSKDVLHYKL